MRRSVRPLLQLQIPPHLASPANWNFRKERLTEEETLEEQGVSQMLPQPFVPKLVAIVKKLLTRCVTVAVHWLIWKVAFETKISQNKVAEKFLVQPKKLHIAITGKKYDPGRKLTKKENVEWAAAQAPNP